MIFSTFSRASFNEFGSYSPFVPTCFHIYPLYLHYSPNTEFSSPYPHYVTQILLGVGNALECGWSTTGHIMEEYF